jgi:hypothetical protein
VFDFGLCKSLSSELKAKDGGYGYRLTGRAGSLPYMAVEVSYFARRRGFQKQLHHEVLFVLARYSLLSRSLSVIHRCLHPSNAQTGHQDGNV